jgi:thiamine-monophosphate kinase
MSLSEFDIINQYFSNVGPVRNDVTLGVGDDCAILSPDHDVDIVVTVDTLVKDIHFDAATPVETLAYKAVMVSVSDIAAMGAHPAWLNLALTLPESDPQWLQLFSAGLREACDLTGISLVGGNISRGPLTISSQVTGMIKKGAAIRRTGARPGDRIYVSGNIGEAGLGLMLHQQKLLANELDQDTKSYLLSRLFKPTARVSIGEDLLSIATACIDISDGLAADLGHLLSASQVGASVELSHIPVNDKFRAVFESAGGWQSPVCGGEDYELCFSAPLSQHDKIKQISACHDVNITQIGTVEANTGLRFTLEGNNYATSESEFSESYRHF